MSATKNAVLGGFVLLTLAVLTYFTFVFADLPLFGRQARWTVYLGQSSMIKKGQDVLTSGMKVGRVDEVAPVPDGELTAGRYVRAVLSVKRNITLWEGARVVLVRDNLLGGFNIHLDRGRPGGRTLSPDTPLTGSVETTSLRSLLGDETTQDLEAILGNLRRFSERDSLGRMFFDDRAYADLTAALESFRKTTDRLEQQLASKETVIGRILNDEELGEKLDATIDSVNRFLKEYEESEGTLRLLIRDEETARNLRELIANLRGTESVAGRLINDEGLGREVDAGVRGATELLQELRRDYRDADGPLSLLLRDREVTAQLRRMAERLESASNDIAAITAKINSQDGTLGRLINDDTIIRDLEAVVAGFRETGEVARENAPLAQLTSFTGFLFAILN
ncbi:MAG: MlaD family protein [Planctomycetota bacterium]